MTKIAGYKPLNDRYDYDQVLKDMAYQIMHFEREHLELPKDSKAGYRFKDNGAVLARIMSWIPASEFAIAPVKYVREALLDCASADWWYEKEKDYGHDHEDD